MSALKKNAAATVATLLISTLFACSSTAENAQKNGLPVAKVNGSVITKPELDRAVQALLVQNKVTQASPEQAQKAAEAALTQLTSAELLYQAASKLEIKDLDKQVAEKYAKNLATFPGTAEYDKALKGLGMTPEEVKESMRKEIVVNNFIVKEIASKVTVTEADAKKFYDENLEKIFKKGETLKASHILISADAKNSALERKNAKEKIEAILKRLRGGEDFAAVAKQESNCPSSARGGELGIFGKGQMAPPFEKVAFALKPGEMSGVVETEFGYHIIKLTEKIPPATAKFEEVKDKITEYVRKAKIQQALSEFVAQLREKARIEKV